MSQFFQLRWLAAWAAFFFTLATLHAVEVGATKDEVIKELGPPIAQAEAADREILTYPKKVQIILEDGKVTNAMGIKLSVETPTPTPEPTPTPAPTPSPRPSNASATRLSPAPTLATSPSHVPVSPPANPPLAHGQHSTLTPNRHVIDRLPVSGKILLLGIHLGLTLLGLQLAFSYWEIELQHSALFLVALIDLMAHGVLDFLGPISEGITTHPGIEIGLPALVMVFTIWSFSVRKKWKDAVQTALLVNLCVSLFQFGFAVLLLSALTH